MRKKYGRIGGIRLMNIRVFYNNQLVYEGVVEECPNEIKLLEYSDIKIGEPTELFVYDD